MTRSSPHLGTPTMHTVVHSSLRCVAHSAVNRRRAQDLAWRWVKTKWPRLTPPAIAVTHDTFERTAPGQELAAASSADGRSWQLSIAHSSDRGGRTWLANVRVADTHHADVLTIRIAWIGHSEGPLIVAPPRLLGLWAEDLDIDDGGIAVIGEPRPVDDRQQAEAFCGHVLSDQRALPVIALAHGERSRYFGVDPRALAESLSGLAHVACLSPAGASIVCERLGGELGPDSGAARIYAPGFTPCAAPDAHPLLRPARPRSGTPSETPGSFRRRLIQRICAVTVDGAALGRHNSAA